METKLVVTRDFVAFPDNEAKLKQMVKDYKDLVVNDETFEEAKKVRKIIRDERYYLQNVEKENTRILNGLKSQNKTMADSFIAIIMPIEQKIDAQIKEIEVKRAAEKAEKEREKQEQMAAWNKKARDILAYTDKLVNPEGVDQVKEIIKEVTALEITEAGYGAYEMIAQQNKGKVLEQAQGVLERLEEAARLKEEQRINELSDARILYKEHFDKNPDEKLTAVELWAEIEDDKAAKLERLAELEKKEKEKKEAIDKKKLKRDGLIEEAMRLSGNTREHAETLSNYELSSEITRLKQLAEENAKMANVNKSKDLVGDAIKRQDEHITSDTHIQDASAQLEKDNRKIQRWTNVYLDMVGTLTKSPPDVKFSESQELVKTLVLNINQSALAIRGFLNEK